MRPTRLRLAACLVATSLATPAMAEDNPASAYAIVADLTTQIGARLDGSPREATARDWAVARLKALGLAHVHIEPFTIAGWARGAEEGAVITPTTTQPLVLTALGDSGATAPEGITAPLVWFGSLSALQAAPAGSLAGKIAFIDHAMPPTQTGESYGFYGDARRKGPAIAAQKGALAVLIRSIGTDHDRVAHTGLTQTPEGTTPIPSAAVSVPDALLIDRIASAGQPMRAHLLLTPRFTGPAPSGNVVAEITGSDPALPPILVGCHLDSWDLATGAIDDGAGCAIITAAALQARARGPMARTIRLLWGGSEERGGLGGEAYAKAHAQDPHAVVLESDTGAGRIWRYVPKFAASNAALAQKIADALSPLGVLPGEGEARGGEDVGQIAEARHSAVIDLNQDMTEYFNIHHTANDTLDKIDPIALQQNVDVWAAALRILGDERGDIAPVK